MRMNYMNDHTYELEQQMKDLINERLSQLCTQLRQFRKETMKKIKAWSGIEPMTIAIRVQALLTKL